MPQVLRCAHGQVELQHVFGKGARSVVARMDMGGQHRSAVAAARQQQQQQRQAATDSTSAAVNRLHHEHDATPDAGATDTCQACVDEVSASQAIQKLISIGSCTVM